MIVTKQFLDSNPNIIFVFGDNTIRKGTGGAAVLRHHPQSYGFITKKFPNNNDISFFKPEEYQKVFDQEILNLINIISDKKDYVFYVSQLGAGLANKYNIFEKIIQPQMKAKLAHLTNVKFLW